MPSHFTLILAGAALFGGAVFAADMLRAETQDSAPNPPRNNQFPVTGPFAVPQDIADLLRRHQKPSKLPKAAQQAQLTDDIPNINKPPDWLIERDAEDEMTIFYPPNLSDGQYVEVIVVDKMSSNSPEFSRMLPVDVHDKLISAAIGTCKAGFNGSPERRTLSRRSGS